MPPLEAMACGTPVIVSQAEALKEVIGDAGMIIESFDAFQIEKALLNFNNLSCLKKELSEQGFVRSREYEWKKLVQRLEFSINNIARQ